MTIEQIRAEIANLVAQAKGISDTADNGVLTAEQQTEFDAKADRIDELKATLARLERAEALTAGAGRQTSPAAAAPAAPAAAPAAAAAPAPGSERIPAHGGSGLEVTDGPADPNCGFADMGDFGLAVMNSLVPGGSTDPRLAALPQAIQALDINAAPSNYMQERGGSAGEGYMVPPQMAQRVWEIVFAEDDILSVVDPEPTSSNSVELLTDETTPWGSTGITAKWRNETTQMTGDKLVTDPRSIPLHELYAFATVTDNLLEDAPRLSDRLTRKAGQAIRWKGSDAILHGTGAGQPQGMFTAASKVSQAKETSQTADTVNATNVLKMASRCIGHTGREVWLINSDVLPQLGLLTIGDQPMWLPPVGLQSNPGGNLLGRRVLVSTHCKTVGDEGDIILLDPAGYYAAVKQGGIKFASSMHLYFDYGMSAFRWTFRLGGAPYLSTALAAPTDHGGVTKSHCVTLAART